MGAQDKLVPAAGVIANNLYGTKYSTKSTFKMTPKVITKYANPIIDAVNFLGSIHAKQLRIADNNAIWNGTLANNPPRSAGLSDQVLSQYATVKGEHDEVLPGFAATSIQEWNELQTGISRSYNIIDLDLIGPPNIFSQLGFSANQTADTLDQLGLIFSNLTLYDAIGNILGVYATRELFANAWNQIKVPFDKTTYGVTNPYIAPVLPNQSSFVFGQFYYWFRSTGYSRWAFPFTGWNLTK